MLCPCKSCYFLSQNRVVYGIYLDMYDTIPPGNTPIMTKLLSNEFLWLEYMQDIGIESPGMAVVWHIPFRISFSLWRHQMESVSALLSFYAGKSLVTGWIPWQRLVTWSFDVFFDDLCQNKRLGKQSKRRWFETPSRSLWHNFDAKKITF